MWNKWLLGDFVLTCSSHLEQQDVTTFVHSFACGVYITAIILTSVDFIVAPSEQHIHVVNF